MPLPVGCRQKGSNSSGHPVFIAFMESPDSKKSTSPVPVQNQTGKAKKGASKKRKAKRGKKTPAPSGKRLSIIKSSDEREELGKEKTKPEGARAGDVASGDGVGALFRQVVGRASSQVSIGIRHHRRRDRASRARNIARVRLLRFYWKSACREVRRFHSRFTLRKILGFYLGVPAAISLVLCLSFLLAKPPQGVAPDTVSRRKPSAGELVQQIQAALGANDRRTAETAVAELEKNYPNEVRTFVARGTVFAQQKNYDEARKSYLHALELVSGLPPALINLGEIEFATDNYAKAASYYEQAGQRLPNNRLILFRRYLCYSLLKDRSKTEAVMKDLAARPVSVEWYFVRASEALHAGKNAEARQIIAAARALFGEQAAAYQKSLKKIGWLK